MTNFKVKKIKKDYIFKLEYSIQDFIDRLERIPDDKWLTDVCRSKDGKKNCVMGHIFDMGGNDIWNVFEEMIATTYMIFPVNDGSDEDYKQDTPRERVVAYLKDLKSGKRKTTYQYMKEDMEEDKKND